MDHAGFTAQHRAIGRASAWAAFLVGQAYAVAALAGFLSLESPRDPIGTPFLSIMALLIVLMSPLMVATMAAVHAYASRENKAYSLTALAFMILLAGVTSTLNFSLWLAIRWTDVRGAPWLALFFPYQWPTLAYALDIFAWDWFFALAMLFAAPVFRQGGLEKMLRILMIVSGVLCLAGLIGALLDPRFLMICILGYGVAGPIVFLLLGVIFGRAPTGPDAALH